ncbi:MAG: hypothetical protein WD824_02770 [Cyclobacteriaceae bacterium]
MTKKTYSDDEFNYELIILHASSDIPPLLQRPPREGYWAYWKINRKSDNKNVTGIPVQSGDGVTVYYGSVSEAERAALAYIGL